MRQKNFLAGFCSGIIIACIVLIFILPGVRYGFPIILGGSGSEKVSLLERQSIMNKLSVLERYVDQYYLNELDADHLADGLYKGLAASLNDPYAAYYTKEEMVKINQKSEGKYVGIGAYVAYDDEKRTVRIIKPYEGGPAEKAGIKAEDLILSIDKTNVTGESLNDIVGLMKGKEGTEVTLGLERKGSDKPVFLDVKREEFETSTVSYRMLDEYTGYIAIASFKENTPKQFEKAIKELKKQEMKKVVFDIRNNGGGSLSAVVNMLNQILPEGKIVSVKNKNGKGKVYKSTNKKFLDLPMACLINENSASASEIFAGALKDRDAAVLVGNTTFGKGIVQSIYFLNDGSAFKLTTANYYTPDGNYIHKKGIDPDIEVKLEDSSLEKENPEWKDDNQLMKAFLVLQQDNNQ